jgi:hypothetical protein
MKKSPLLSLMILSAVFMIIGCQKESQSDQQHYNLDVTLSGGKAFGSIKFTQSQSKIITLDTKVARLLPHHEYLLQRAVDAINVVDGNCTSTTWLTLGKGLTPQSIVTDADGNGEESLWRDVSAIASGSKFDIHFQIIDAATTAVVLTSDCYWYQVR